MTFYFLLSSFIHLGIALSTSLFDDPKVQIVEPINFVEIQSAPPVPAPAPSVAKIKKAKPTKAVAKKAQKPKSKKLVTQKDPSPVIIPPANVEGAPLPAKVSESVKAQEVLKPSTDSNPTLDKARTVQEANSAQGIVAQETNPSPVSVPQEVSSAKASEELIEKKSLPSPQPAAVSTSANNLSSGARDARTLRQKPGNKSPTYSLKDRLQRNMGEVVVLGYLNKRGFIEKPQVLKNSGSVDMQNSSLKAFSSFRFEEGQEGWVKMPFQFILSGNAETLSTRDRAETEKFLKK